MSNRIRHSRRMRYESLESRTMLHGDPVAHFSLVDVNETSETYNQAISPSDYNGADHGVVFRTRDVKLLQ